MISKITYINLALALVCILLLFKTIGVWQGGPPPAADLRSVGVAQQAAEDAAQATDRIRFGETRVSPKSAFDNIGARNLFSADRAEYLPPATESVTPVVEEAPLAKVDGRQIRLSGVVIMDDLTTALITDPGIRGGRGQQRWVRPGDSVGQLRVDSIEPHSVLFLDETSKRFRVELHDAGKPRSTAGPAPPAAGRPTVVTTQPTPETRPETRPAAPAPAPPPPATGRSSDDTDDYVIIQTPFGEMKRPRHLQ